MILSDGACDGVVMGVIRAGWFNLGLARESIFWKLSRLLRRPCRRRIDAFIYGTIQLASATYWCTCLCETL